MIPPTRVVWRIARIALAMLLLATAPADMAPADAAAAADKLPSIDEVIKAKTDILGEAAQRQTDGPSYEFFADAMPPLRYVNAAFRHYPIVLAAPRNGCKARLVSNGSAVNAQGVHQSWPDVGFPVHFHVGPEEAAFGDDLARLDGPRLADGYLPIVEMSYRDANATYQQEVFVGVGPGLADHGVVWVRFRLAAGQEGKVVARVTPPAPLRLVGGRLCNEREEVALSVGPNWQWDPATQTLSAALGSDREAVLAVCSAPVPESSAGPLAASGDAHRAQRERCVAVWQELLGQGVTLQTPEAVVNNAWRATTAASFAVITGDTVNYSAGNAYETEYITEGSRTVGALMLFGFFDQSRPMVLSLLDHDIRDHKYAVTGWKLRTLAHTYWLTRDADFVRANRHRWGPLLKLILDDLDPQTGLTPKDFYASDIPKPVWNLKTNANCWCALRGMAAVLRDMGEPNSELEERARQYRQAIFEAVDKNVYRDVDPPFVPNTLLDGIEKPYESLTESCTGSYWCLVANDMLGTGVFDARPEIAGWILDTLHRRGGVCMGMLRFDQHSGLFANGRGVDDNYTTGYVLHLLRHDDVDRALVSFYGKLAQGFTRDTFVGGEGTSLDPLDAWGRPMYLPPCTAGNAFYLWTLRNLLVQDWDTDDDGAPDTLRLLHAVPSRWLAEGAAIQFENAPTAFGPLSLKTESRLAEGCWLARIDLPPRQHRKTLLRARLPDGWRAVSAAVNGAALSIDPTGIVDLSRQTGRINVQFQVQRQGDFSSVGAADR